MSAPSWQKIVQKVKDQYDCFLIADIVPSPEPRTELFSAFDGIHIYNPTSYINQQRQISLNQSSLGSIDKIYESISQTAKTYGKLCALTTIPGYDDTVIRDPGILIKRNNGKTYDYLWESSLKADWVLITSFNEWHEGTEIEPSTQHGDYYIDRTKYWADDFKS